MLRMFGLALGLWLAPTVAFAQETVDIGVVKQSQLSVVQKLLYPKSDRTELGIHLGLMPGQLLTTPNLQFSFDRHLSERLAVGGSLGGGYGLKTGMYRELESPLYGVAPDAYRYLASAKVGAQFSPAYAKMNLGGKRIVHYDVYAGAHLGASLEQSVIPGGGITVAPGLSLSLGSRFFLPKGGAIRVQVQDDLLIEHRKLTDSTHFKQNVNVTIGYSFFSPKPGKR